VVGRGAVDATAAVVHAATIAAAAAAAAAAAITFLLRLHFTAAALCRVSMRGLDESPCAHEAHLSNREKRSSNTSSKGPYTHNIRCV
jgi:hypothetical protein